MTEYDNTNRVALFRTMMPSRSDALETARKAKAEADREKWITMFRFQARALQLPPWREEYRFAADLVGWNVDREPGERLRVNRTLRPLLRAAELKDWRFDVAWPELKIAVEIDGAIGTGRHTRREGFISDAQKDNMATAYGWRVFRFPGQEIKSGSAVALLARVIRPGPLFMPLERRVSSCGPSVALGRGKVAGRVAGASESR